MFERPVRQLLLGYLGKYIKYFHKKQLKITLDEIVLKDVELILEAFDYLQLPVALKRCHVCRLRIGISWKKLSWESWDPIVISLQLEDVLFCAGPRDDHEWSIDAVERRELAAKKAKLAAAELAKLSRRVCDNQAGQSLISHVTGRILDSIQVSMRNVHIVYCDIESPSMLFGLRFSSLEMKQAPDGPLSSKARGGQVNKTVEICGLGIYCRTLEGFLGSLDVIGENELWEGAITDVDKYDYLVTPFDLSLQVTKSGKLELDAPQYSVAVELTKLVMTINSTQLQHILKFSDYICTCRLREKYGRYCPWDCPLSKKLKGWQQVWWGYAKESVLFDVRKGRKKTAWWYLGQKLVHLRKYVNLYKVKLDFLQREQSQLVQDISLSTSGRLRRSLCLSGSLKQSVTACDQPHQHKRSKTRFIHRVTLTTPLTVKNYLPHPMSVTIESGGATLKAVVKEVEASFFHVDSSHDLGVTFNIAGFGPAAVNFPLAETFSATAKPSGTVLSLTETMALSADLSDGAIYVVVEKMMDSLSGARELCISVPFLLYNCTGFALTVSRSDHELQGNYCIFPTCYDSTEQGLFIEQKDVLHLLPSEDKPHPRALNYDSESNLSKKHIISSKKFVDPHSGIILTQSSVSHGTMYHQSVNQMDLVEQEDSRNNLTRNSDTDNQSDFKVSNVSNNECLKATPVMYSPDPSSVASEIMVKVTRYPAEYPIENLPSSSWSSPFFLVAPSGSTAVLVPEPSSSSASVISVTSHLLDTPLMGRTRAITFQPIYVISNACSKPLWYKQKDTEFLVRLGVGQHSHLHWIDTTRELLLTACFYETGCQWSGCFHPDHLGDTQVKMRNYFSGASNIIRIEVQNADVIKDEKIIDNAIGKSGTNIILLSDDDTGFMPYRIDNFTKEVHNKRMDGALIHLVDTANYQQKCETLETIVHPYTSRPYAWDEPFFPHRLIVEVPGKRTLGWLGPYTLDDVKEYPPIKLVSSSMSLEHRHEKTLLSSVRAEGAMKVLSIIDSSCHVLEEVKSPSSILSGKKENKGVEMNIDYKEKVSVKISFIEISLMDSSPQELLYASAKDIRVDFLQCVERQSFSFQIFLLQIDNQLRGTPYPVVLSFDEDFKGSLVSQMRNKDGGTKTKIESVMTYAVGISSEPKICLAASKWRNKEIMLLSFEYISLRIGDLSLELDLELLLKLLEFIKVIPLLNSDNPASVTVNDDLCKLGVVDRSFSFTPQNSEYLQTNGDHQFSKKLCTLSDNHTNTPLLPEVVPIGAPWQKIFLLARTQDKIYVEDFSLAPVKMTLSFSSNPWMLKSAGFSSGESLIHRGIMALADVEGAQVCLKELTITHHMASWGSIQEILLKHYSRQFLHEMYKVFGSAGVIGNPMGFARRVGLGVKDFFSVPAKGVLQGLTCLLQSPIKGAEKHGLPGILSGFALGVTGLVAKPAASVLEATGRTAQSIRNWSRLYRTGPHHLRVRLPRALSAELPLRCYSWDEAIGTAVLLEVDGSKFRDEVLVMCKALQVAGEFVVLTEKLILIIECSSLVDLGKSVFQGIVAEPEWKLVAEIALESVIHHKVDGKAMHIVGSSSEALIGKNQHHHHGWTGGRMKLWSKSPNPLPLFQTDLEFASKEEAEYFLEVLSSTIKKGREQGWGKVYLLHQSNLRKRIVHFLAL